jgi:hypothetical protein
MFYKKGMKFRSLITNDYRIKGHIYTITMDENNRFNYTCDIKGSSHFGKNKNGGHPSTIELLNDESSGIDMEYYMLDCFQRNFRID